MSFTFIVTQAISHLPLLVAKMESSTIISTVAPSNLVVQDSNLIVQDVSVPAPHSESSVPVDQNLPIESEEFSDILVVQDEKTSLPKMGLVNAIVPGSLEVLRDTITKNFGNLIFRRVSQVVAKKEHLIETVVTRVVPGVNPPGTPLSIIYKAGTPREPPTAKEYEQNVEERYSRFYFFTTENAIRNNDHHGKIPLFGASNKYSQIDIVGPNMDFRFSYENEDRMNQVPPRVGDLICGIITKDKYQRKNPSYKFWFTCSDQFLHAWTAIRYAEHETLDKLVTRPAIDFIEGRADHESEVRKALLKGNKLCTNSYRKWMRANNECGVAFDQAEAEKRYYSLRCERNAVDWVHVYAALTLILRYREVPNQSNIPSVLDGGATPKSWDLPDGWVERFIKKYGLEQAYEQRKIYAHANRMRTTPEIGTPKEESFSEPSANSTVDNSYVTKKSDAIKINRKIPVPDITNTPTNTPSSPILSHSINSPKYKISLTRKPKYANVEFDDNLIFDTPKSDAKIIELDFPPLPGYSAENKFMPIGAWADENEKTPDKEIDIIVDD